MRFPFKKHSTDRSLLDALRAMTGPLAAFIAGLALALGMVSCGGGGDGVSGGGTGGGGGLGGGGGGGGSISFRPAISFGSISGLGSIFVGGYEFDDSPGKLTAQDGFPVSSSDLGLGAQVSVVNEKTSQTLALNANNLTSSIQIKRLFMGVLRGDANDRSMALLNGQVIYFDRRTAVVGAADTTELNGAFVQVAGYLEPSLNQVVVTRIEPASKAQLVQGQIYLTARVQSLSAGSATASVGFATVSLAGLQLPEAVQVNDIVRVQGSFSALSSTTVIASKVTKIKPASGLGGSTFRGIVSSRPTTAEPATALVVDGYEVQVQSSQVAFLAEVRLGSVVEVQGTLDDVIVKNAKLMVVSEPKVLLPGDKPGPPPPIINNPRPSADYVISKSPVQSVNSDNSFVVRGVRVVFYVGPTDPPPQPVTVGQVVSIAGEARSDALGFYVLALSVTSSATQ